MVQVENYKIPIAKPLMADEEKKAVLEVLSSGHLIQGEKVEKFEKDFAKYIGVKHCIAVNSGTAALHLAALAAGLKPGDEAITTPFSFAASANCVLYCGAKPVFSDIDPRTFNMNPEKIKDVITSKTKCIIPVHLYGQPAEMDQIKDIADARGFFVIEDAAQAHGAEYKKKKAGSIGNIGCFSFYPTKNMTTGEGGAVTTNDEEFAEKIRLLRNHGQKVQYYHSTLGFNFRMTDITAAIGIEQLKKLEKFNERRIENAKILTERLSGTKEIVTPFVSPTVRHVFHQYTIRVNVDGGSDKNRVLRDKLQQKLSERGVQTKVYYPIPIHKQELYLKLGYNNKFNIFPEAEAASDEVLSLPVHPSLSIGDLENISNEIRRIMQ